MKLSIHTCLQSKSWKVNTQQCKNYVHFIRRSESQFQRPLFIPLRIPENRIQSRTNESFPLRPELCTPPPWARSRVTGVAISSSPGGAVGTPFLDKGTSSSRLGVCPKPLLPVYPKWLYVGNKIGTQRVLTLFVILKIPKQKASNYHRDMYAQNGQDASSTLTRCRPLNLRIKSFMGLLSICSKFSGNSSFVKFGRACTNGSHIRDKVSLRISSSL